MALQRVQIGPFDGGLNDNEAQVGPRELSVCRNLEWRDGELRTRRGCKWLGSVAPGLEVQLARDDGVVTTNVTSINIGGLTVGNFWYFASYVTGPIFEPIATDTTGIRSWKSLRYQFTMSASNTAAVNPNFQFWDGNSWVTIAHREYYVDANSIVRQATTHAQGSTWFVVLGQTGHWSGDDHWFDTWQSSAVGGRTAYWIRVSFNSGTTTAGVTANGSATMPWRPTGLLAYTTRGGGSSVVAAATARLTARGNSGTSLTSLYHVIAASDIGVIDQQTTPYTIMTRQNSAASDNEVRDNYDRYLKRAGYTSNIGPEAARYDRIGFKRSHGFVYSKWRGLLLAAFPGGVVAGSEMSAEQEQFDNGITTATRRVVTDEYPEAVSDVLVGESDDFYKLRDLGSPYQPIALAEHDERIWFLYENGVLRWTFPQVFVDIVPAEAYLILADEDGSRLVAAKSWNGFLVVFTESSIWLVERIADQKLTPSQIQAYTARKVVSGLGTFSPSSVCEVEGELWFAHRSGIYAFDGSPSPRKVSGRIQRTFDIGFSVPGMEFCALEYYKNRQQVWFSAMRSGGWKNDVVYTFDLGLVREDGSPTIYRFTEINAEQLEYDESTGRLLAADAIGNVWELDTGVADGYAGDVPVEFEARTGNVIPAHDPGAYMATAASLYLRQFVGTIYRVSMLVDGVETAIDSFDVDYSRSAVPPQATDEIAWGASGFVSTDTGFAPVPQNLRRHALRVPQRPGEDLRLRLRSAATAVVGDRLGLVTANLKVKTVGELP